MTPLLDIVSATLLLSGTFFFITATLGLLRFPDIYTRLHAAAKGDTLGAGLILLGLAIQAGFRIEAIKILIMVCFMFLTSPVAAHAISRAVYFTGIKPWVKEEKK